MGKVVGGGMAEKGEEVGSVAEALVVTKYKTAGDIANRK
jgi:hypothetical protein